jgi:type I restriction enzyme S subunit
MKVFKLEKVIAHMKNGVNVKQNKNGVGDRLSRIETISDGNFNFDKVGFADLSSDQKSKYKININDILFSHINSLEHL